MTQEPRRRSQTLLLALGIAAASGFIIGRALDLYWLRMLTKPIPVLAMIALVRASDVDRYSRRIALGLVASVTGDVLLEYSPTTFLPGVIAFLSAHVIYITAFLRRAPHPRLGLALPFALWGGLAFIELGPGLGAMTIPVAIYTAAIAVMGWRACALVGAQAGREPWITAAGAIAFMASDTLLAFNKFHAPIVGAGYAIITLYWLGQLGIAASAWNALRPREGR